MSFNIKDKALQANLARNLEKAQRENSDALEKLSSGSVFTRNDPRPAERALAEGLEFKLRSLATSKSNVNSAVNLLQTAETSLSEITNMVLRMKEINTAAASTTVSDKERRFLFIEYEALHEEINRIATTTEFNGIPLLNGDADNAPEELIFRVGDPAYSDDAGYSDEDVNVIRFEGMNNVVATTAALGLKSARDLLGGSDDAGIGILDVEDLLTPEDNFFASAYDQALNVISTQRAVFGAMQSRLQHATDFLDVYQENIAAAKSSIADVDYASESSRMIQSRILLQAGTAVMAQGNINSQLALNLLNAL